MSQENLDFTVSSESKEENLLRVENVRFLELEEKDIDTTLTENERMEYENLKKRREERDKNTMSLVLMIKN